MYVHGVLCHNFLNYNMDKYFIFSHFVFFIFGLLISWSEGKTQKIASTSILLSSALLIALFYQSDSLTLFLYYEIENTSLLMLRVVAISVFVAQFFLVVNNKKNISIIFLLTLLLHISLIVFLLKSFLVVILGLEMISIIEYVALTKNYKKDIFREYYLLSSKYLLCFVLSLLSLLFFYVSTGGISLSGFVVLSQPLFSLSVVFFVVAMLVKVFFIIKIFRTHIEEQYYSDVYIAIMWVSKIALVYVFFIIADQMLGEVVPAFQNVLVDIFKYLISFMIVIISIISHRNHAVRDKVSFSFLLNVLTSLLCLLFVNFEQVINHFIVFLPLSTLAHFVLLMFLNTSKSKNVQPAIEIEHHPMITFVYTTLVLAIMGLPFTAVFAARSYILGDIYLNLNLEILIVVLISLIINGIGYVVNLCDLFQNGINSKGFNLTKLIPYVLISFFIILVGLYPSIYNKLIN